MADKDKESRHRIVLDRDVNDVREPSGRGPRDKQVGGVRKSGNGRDK